MHEVIGKKITYALCSRSGFTKQLDELAGERGDLQLYNWPSMVAG